MLESLRLPTLKQLLETGALAADLRRGAKPAAGKAARECETQGAA